MSGDKSIYLLAQRSVKRWSIAVIVALLFVVVPPLLGFGGTIIGMIRAFRTLGKSGGADPDAMAESIGFALMTTATGLMVALTAVIPLIITIVGLVRARRRLAVSGQG